MPSLVGVRLLCDAVATLRFELCSARANPLSELQNRMRRQACNFRRLSLKIAQSHTPIGGVLCDAMRGASKRVCKYYLEKMLILH